LRYWILATIWLGLLAVRASAVAIDWVPIGDPGNPADGDSCYAAGCGSVGYSYYISKYEVTNAQYAEFLNARAASDPHGLYDDSMGSDSIVGGITRSGVAGSYAYAAKPGLESKPVVYVSFEDALRFANWLNNGQGSGDTETGAYTLGSPLVARNPGAITFLPSENEWYKAAYYDAAAATYFDYPTGTNAVTACAPPASDGGNSANCGGVVGGLTEVGAYASSDSPYGTFDQGGNVREWNEQRVLILYRGVRGGGWDSAGLATYSNSTVHYEYGWDDVGLRVASLVPEPGTSLLVAAGLAALAARRSGRAGA